MADEFDSRYTDEAGTPEDIIIGTGSFAIPLSAVRRAIDAELTRNVTTFAALQTAINNLTSGEIIIPEGVNIALTAQLVMTNPIRLRIDGTITATVPGTAGTPMILIKSSNVKIYGKGTIDGGTSLWCGIAADLPTGVLERIEVSGLLFKNIGVDNTSTYVIGFMSVKDGRIENNTLKNCGVIGNVVGGGFGIYMQFNENTVVRKNSLYKVGSSGINTSAGLNCLIVENYLEKISLFGMKGGYGLTESVSNHIAPTATSFSIPKTDGTGRTWFIGSGFIIATGLSSKVIGKVKKIEDMGTYYKITCTDMGSVPVVGNPIELYDTGTKFLDNTIVWTGDNGFDLNVMMDVTIRGNYLKYGGWYQEVGTFAGLHAGIWIGADPQGSYNCWESFGATIEGNIIEWNYGSAIEIFSTHDVVVRGNTCRDYNQVNDASLGGIEVGRLGYFRTQRCLVEGNICKSAYGYGVLVSYAQNVIVQGNIIISKLGIRVNSMVAALIEGNTVTIDTAGNGYTLRIEDASAANATSGVTVTGNAFAANGANSIGVDVTDVGAAGIDVFENNAIGVEWNGILVQSVATAPIRGRGYATFNKNPIQAPGNQSREGEYHGSIAVGVTVELGRFVADNGTAGMMEIVGIARNGTTDAEAFRVIVIGGYLATTVVNFTSLGVSRGAAFLAAGDFTLTASGDGTCIVKYTNNDANEVSIRAKVTALSRQ